MSKNKIFVPCNSSVNGATQWTFQRLSFVYKKRVHGNEKMSLPCGFGKCPESLHFTLLSPLMLMLKMVSSKLKDSFEG